QPAGGATPSGQRTGGAPRSTARRTTSTARPPAPRTPRPSATHTSCPPNTRRQTPPESPPSATNRLIGPPRPPTTAQRKRQPFGPALPRLESEQPARRLHVEHPLAASAGRVDDLELDAVGFDRRRQGARAVVAADVTVEDLQLQHEAGLVGIAHHPAE